MSYGLKLGTYRGICSGSRGDFKEYTITLVQGLCERAKRCNWAGKDLSKFVHLADSVSMDSSCGWRQRLLTACWSYWSMFLWQAHETVHMRTNVWSFRGSNVSLGGNTTLP